VQEVGHTQPLFPAQYQTAPTMPMPRVDPLPQNSTGSDGVQEPDISLLPNRNDRTDCGSRSEFQLLFDGLDACTGAKIIGLAVRPSGNTDATDDETACLDGNTATQHHDAGDEPGTVLR